MKLKEINKLRAKITFYFSQFQNVYISCQKLRLVTDVQNKHSKPITQLWQVKKIF